MNAIQIGMMFRQEIEAQRTSGAWKWEKRVSGPISASDVGVIASLAGCWCDVPSADAGQTVRFYTNQNHPAHGGCPW